MSFTDVGCALDALEARGARGFDRDGCDLVRSLIARGAALPPPADGMVLERARLHLARLDERFEHALELARTQLSAAEDSEGGLPDHKAALARGELRALRRDLRRVVRAGERSRARAQRMQSRDPHGASEYEEASAELSAQFTVARAVEDMPVDAGPYNPLRIATGLLERLGTVSPTYLTVQLRRLDELAIMLTLPEAPRAQVSAPTPAPARPRGRTKRKSRN